MFEKIEKLLDAGFTKDEIMKLIPQDAPRRDEIQYGRHGREDSGPLEDDRVGGGEIIEHQPTLQPQQDKARQDGGAHLEHPDLECEQGEKLQKPGHNQEYEVRDEGDVLDLIGMDSAGAHREGFHTEKKRRDQSRRDSEIQCLDSLPHVAKIDNSRE